jgi:hypothetical protein
MLNSRLKLHLKEHVHKLVLQEKIRYKTDWELNNPIQVRNTMFYKH